MFKSREILGPGGGGREREEVERERENRTLKPLELFTR